MRSATRRPVPGADTSATVAALDELIVRARRAAPQIALGGALLGQRFARFYATMGHPYHLQVRTGELRASIRAHTPFESGVDVWESRTYPTVIYARLQELGGNVYPKRVKYLHWIGQPEFGDAPGPQYRKHVYIPRRPYLAPGRRTAIVPYGVLARQRMAEALRGG